jgi:hypothetical protein
MLKGIALSGKRWGLSISPSFYGKTGNALQSFIPPARIFDGIAPGQNVACHPAAFPGKLRPMKKLIWLLPLLIILGAMLVTVEMKSQTHEVIIQYDYGNLVDTRGRIHSVRLVFHPDGSVTWRDLTPHIR